MTLSELKDTMASFRANPWLAHPYPISATAGAWAVTATK
jgi:hypothetical protein